MQKTRPAVLKGSSRNFVSGSLKRRKAPCFNNFSCVETGDKATFLTAYGRNFEVNRTAHKARPAGGRSLIYGVTGHPLSHTLSPAIHNSLFRHYGLDAVYLVFERAPDKFDSNFIDGLKAMKVSGFNVTLPYKGPVMEFLDRIDPLAKRIAAVNTVVNRNGKLHGYNTDDYGFYMSMITRFRGFKFKDSTILVLGAGGAAFGVAFTCLKHGCGRLIIANRTMKRAASLEKHLRKNFPAADIRLAELREDLIAAIKEQPDLIVNTTSWGLKQNEKKSLISLKDCDSGTLVNDIIYNPAKTPLLREAERRGLKNSNGLAMLLFQGFESFRIWTGMTPDYSLAKRIIFPSFPAQIRG